MAVENAGHAGDTHCAGALLAAAQTIRAARARVVPAVTVGAALQRSGCSNRSPTSAHDRLELAGGFANTKNPVLVMKANAYGDRPNRNLL